MSYTVPLEQGNERQVTPSVKSLEDLPVFLRRLITVSAKVTYKQAVALIFFLAQVPWFFIWYQITQSFVGAAVITLLSALTGYVDLYFQPDFSRGFFLNVLLSDLSHTKKLDKEVKSGIVANAVVTSIVMSAFTYFFIVPFANSELLGEHTFNVTVIGSTFGIVAFVVANVVGVGVSILIPPLRQKWEKEVKEYLKTVRKTLLLEDEEVAHIEDGKNKTSWIVNKLSIEQRKIDQFARSFSNGVGKYFGASAMIALLWLAFCTFFYNYTKHRWQRTCKCTRMFHSVLCIDALLAIHSVPRAFRSESCLGRNET